VNKDASDVKQKLEVSLIDTSGNDDVNVGEEMHARCSTQSIFI
jgi:hypothetical protein